MSQLSLGDSAPWFRAPTLEGSSNFGFDTAAGRYVLLLFAGSAGNDQSAAAMRMLGAHRRVLDDERACFFGITSDPGDAAAGRIAKVMPGIRWFLDYDRAVARSYGVADDGGGYRPQWMLLDPMLRVVGRVRLAEGPALLAHLASLVKEPEPEGLAPVLVIPRVFDFALCRKLIGLYDSNGGEVTGFMREVEGKTTGILDDSFKRRRDFHIDDETELCAHIRHRLTRTVVPQVQRAFQFDVTRIERYIVACYDGDGEGGFFRAHRDNTTIGTAHRRFACTINLNAEDYEGGELRFPEFGSKRYRAPTGGAVVFSCSLLHEAMPVTRGKRYAYLPFLYDDAAARMREANAKSGKVGANLASYRA